MQYFHDLIKPQGKSRTSKRATKVLGAYVGCPEIVKLNYDEVIEEHRDDLDELFLLFLQDANIKFN